MRSSWSSRIIQQPSAGLHTWIPPTRTIVESLILLGIYLSFYLSIYLSINIYISIYISIWPSYLDPAYKNHRGSFDPARYLSIYIYLSISILSVYIYIWPSYLDPANKNHRGVFDLARYLSIFLSIYISIYKYLYIYLYIYLAFIPGSRLQEPSWSFFYPVKYLSISLSIHDLSI